MSRALGLAVLALLALLALLFWQAGGGAGLAGWVAERQQGLQATLANAIRALKQGTPGATTGFLTIAFVYGFVHAAGPGHGKFLVAGYAAARQVGFAKIAGIGLAAGIFQALVAIAVIGGLVLVTDITRDAAGAVAQRYLRPLSIALIIGLGGVLIWRGAQQIGRAQLRTDGQGAKGARHGSLRLAQRHLAGTSDPNDRYCQQCGSEHGPGLMAIARAHSWPEIAALIAGAGIRPCTGALFLLIITWQFDLFFTGVLGALAMGVGSGLVSVVVGLLAVLGRESAYRGFRLLPGSMALALGQVLIGALLILSGLWLPALS